MTPNMTSKPSANNMYLCKDVVITQLFSYDKISGFLNIFTKFFLQRFENTQPFLNSS